MSNQTSLFSDTPINKAVLQLAIPAVITQLITVAYNMADTFFIGQIGNPKQVAAVSICLPIYMVTTGISNVFGIGGASLISRCLGNGNNDKVKFVSSSSFWNGILFAILYSVFVLVVNRKLLYFCGCDDEVYEFAKIYSFWTVIVGAVPTLINSLLSHFVRAEGYSKEASFGVAFGAVLNICLDPIFILVLRMDIMGAALATSISNIIAAVYYIVFVFKTKSLSLSLNIKHYCTDKDMIAEIILVGFPSFLMNTLAVCSNIVLNRLLSMYCNEAIAGAGIAKKIDSLMYALSNGISQGVLPLIGYNYSSKNYERFEKSIKSTLKLSLTITTISSLLLFFGAKYIISFFIDDYLTIYYGSIIQRIICVTGPLSSVTTITIVCYQAMGQKLKPAILSLLRKGALDIPTMILMNKAIGVFGIALGIPIADFGAMLVSLFFIQDIKEKIRSDKI